MTIRILSEHGDQWETQNITTNQTIFFKKSVLDHAIRFGKAEIVEDSGNVE